MQIKVKHDIITFNIVTEKVGKEAKYLHKGMTSSDVLDTGNIQLKQSGEIILKDIDRLPINKKTGFKT